MDFIGILNFVTNSLVGIYDLFTALLTFLKSMVFIVPTPYRSVILLFLTVNMGIIIWKLVRS